MAAATEESRSPKPLAQVLVEHVERGEMLDLAGDQAVDEDSMRLWDDSRTIPASVIRDIVRGRLAPDPDPHGLQVRGARISGRLDLANITSTVVVKLVDCLFEEGLTVWEANLPGLFLTGCRIEHPSGPALNAVRLTTAVLDLARVTATAHSAFGAVMLQGAHLSVLTCENASIHNDTGPALQGGYLRVDHGVFLSGFTAVGSGELGAVRLTGSHLSGLACDGASMHNHTGPALQADNMRVDQDLCLGNGFDAVGGGDGVAVDLTGVRLGNGLVFDPVRLEHRTNPNARLRVDGLMYAGLPVGISTDDWLGLLRAGTPDYAAQPYQHLAATHRAAGHDTTARRILMAQRRDQIQRHTLTGRGERSWARFTGLTLGYGYQPWRALIGLLLVVILAVLLAVLAGGHGGLTQVHSPPPQTPAPCTMVQRVGVGLNLGTPLIPTGARPGCEATSTTVGQFLTITGWALQLMAWAFATLFIAGFTSAVRKT